MRDGEDDGDRWRPVLIGLGALVGVSVLVGGLVAVVALGAVSFAGLGDADGPTPSSRASLYMPPLSPTPKAPEPSGPTSSGPTSSGPSSSAPTSPAPGKTKKAKRKPSTISLTAFPTTVASSQRINLTGVYRRGEGATLQVQRFEGGWKDFPTTATVRGGIFTTYVMTSRTGKNRFRVLDKATGRSSNPVSVTVR
jgi:hypothetical protein